MEYIYKNGEPIPEDILRQEPEVHLLEEGKKLHHGKIVIKDDIAYILHNMDRKHGGEPDNMSDYPDFAYAWGCGDVDDFDLDWDGWSIRIVGDVQRVKSTSGTKEKLKRIFRDNLYKRHTTTTTSGKIAGKRLFAYKTSKKLMRKPTEESGKKYCIEILIDASGSMGGDYNIAWEAGVKLCRLLESVADVNVTFFNYLWSTIPSKKMTMKAQGGKLDPFHRTAYEKEKDGIVYITKQEKDNDRHFSARYGNWDILPIMERVHHLQQNSHTKKIVIVLADGAPNLDEHNHQNPPQNLCLQGRFIRSVSTQGSIQKKIEKIEKTSDVKIYGVGINATVPYIHEDRHIQIRNAGKIESTFLDILQKTI